MRGVGGVTVRYAFPDDAVALARLAELDSARVPEGTLLVAEVDGELWAAMSLTENAYVADPFRRSSDLVLLLGARVRQLRAQSPSRRSARRTLPLAVFGRSAAKSTIRGYL